jgi:hypothetical protein
MGKITFRKSLAALAVAATLGISMQAFAEDGSGFISGNSISSGGEKLGGVSITVKNIDTGLTRSALSDEDGMFRFPLLPAGKYSIEASKDGYSLSRQDSFVVSSSGKTNIDIALNSDSNMERIEVNGASISSFDISSSESKLGCRLLETFLQ